MKTPKKATSVAAKLNEIRAATRAEKASQKKLAARQPADFAAGIGTLITEYVNIVRAENDEKLSDEAYVRKVNAAVTRMKKGVKQMVLTPEETLAVLRQMQICGATGESLVKGVKRWW